MIEAKAIVGRPTANEQLKSQMVIPIRIPEMAEIETLAYALHQKSEPFEDEVWGWEVTYDPEETTPPLDSKMAFTPALFTIGTFPIWFVSFSWEQGRDHEPEILIVDESLMREKIQPAVV